MSWISRLLFGSPASAHAVLGAGNVGAAFGPISPWAASAEMQSLVYSDIYGSAAGREAVTRTTAMTVAPIGRGRNLIVGNLAGLPFEQGEYIDGEFVPDATQPAWLTQSETVQSPWLRFALSLDDLIFTGWCLWAVERDGSGAITDAVRVQRERWAFDTSSPTGVKVDNKDVEDSRSVILFAGPHEGLLVVAADTIRGWRHMESSWVGRVRNPIPLIVLHEKEANGVGEAEAQAIVKAYAEARTSPTGAVSWLPAGIDLEVHGDVEADLFEKGRNAVRLDVANHLNLPASALDGSAATASLTYVTKEGDRTQLIDDLEFWIDPFDARLSQPDVTAPGKVIRLRRATMSAVPNDPYGSDRGTPEAAQPSPAPAETTEGAIDE